MFATRHLSSAIATALLFAFAPLAWAQDAASDPPDRVVRLAYQSGDVEFAPAGDDNWGAADVNRPLVTGDRLETGRDGRIALELGDASVRVDNGSAFNLLDLDSDTAQFELSQGALNLRVRRLAAGQNYEVDTPTIAFVADQPGNYRVDIAPDGDGSMVTVFAGSGTVYGEDGVSKQVVGGHSYRFGDSRLASVSVLGIPAPDAFDRFNAARDGRYEHSISRRYVSEDVIGYDDLDEYGDWSPSADYGAVWYPTRVARNWAPYHDGHWAWIDPWGWTWVDNAPWGFAPSHYGRWAYIGHRWGWVPCHSRERSIYAPALVAFFGGSHFSIAINLGGGEPVGWFPLGPRDVYQPPYRVTRNYFTNINVTNVRVVNNTTVINNIYNNYSSNRPGPPIRYNNRDVPGAATVVPRNVFTGARPVAGAALPVRPKDLADAQVTPIVRVPPNAASLGIRPGTHPGLPMQRFERPIVVRHAPPAPSVPFAERIRVIANQGGAPLAPTQLRDLRRERASEQHAPTRVVVAAPGGGAVNPARPDNRADRIRPVAPGAPMRAGADTGPTAAPRPVRTGELPSARFAHPRPGSPAAQPVMDQGGNPAAANGNTGIVPPRMRAGADAPQDTVPVPNGERPMQASRDPAMDNASQARQRGFVRAPRADAQAPLPQDARERSPQEDAPAMRQDVAGGQDSGQSSDQPRGQRRMPRVEPTQDVVREPRGRPAPIEQPRVMREPLQRREPPVQRIDAPRIEPQRVEPREPRVVPQQRPQGDLRPRVERPAKEPVEKEKKNDEQDHH